MRSAFAVMGNSRISVEVAVMPVACRVAIVNDFSKSGIREVAAKKESTGRLLHLNNYRFAASSTKLNPDFVALQILLLVPVIADYLVVFL